MYVATKVTKQNKEQSALFWFVEKFIKENLNHESNSKSFSKNH
jgi:hypothetical protein